MFYVISSNEGGNLYTFEYTLVEQNTTSPIAQKVAGAGSSDRTQETVIGHKKQ